MRFLKASALKMNLRKWILILKALGKIANSTILFVTKIYRKLAKTTYQCKLPLQVTTIQIIYENIMKKVYKNDNKQNVNQRYARNGLARGFGSRQNSL